MKKQVPQTAKTHHSAVLDEFLSLGTPEEYARTETRMVLAAKIDDALKAKGIGKKQFAEMMGQSPSVITKWLSGGHNFTVDTLTDIQRVLGVRLLATEEKPVVAQKLHITVHVQVSQPNKVERPTGQPYSMPSIQTDKVSGSRESFQRQSNLA